MIPGNLNRPEVGQLPSDCSPTSAKQDITSSHEPESPLSEVERLRTHLQMCGLTEEDGSPVSSVLEVPFKRPELSTRKLDEILDTKITRNDPGSFINYETTLRQLLLKVADGCDQVLLRGSATLKVMGFDGIKSLFEQLTLPEEVETAIIAQLEAPLNDVDIHLILPRGDSLTLVNMRDRITTHLSDSNNFKWSPEVALKRIQKEHSRKYARCCADSRVGKLLIEELGLKALLKWKGDMNNLYEIVTLPGNIDIIPIANKIERPCGVLAKDVAIDIKPHLAGKGISLTKDFGGGWVALFDLIQR